MTLGEFLKSQRELKQWKQPEAAQQIDIEQSYLSKLENNKAIPSAEIFDKLMHAYQFSMPQFSDAVQSSELDKLKDIMIVREFILSTKKRQDKDKRRFLVTGILMSMLGGLLLSLGVVMYDHKTASYHYESKGEISLTESDYLYAELPEYREFLSIMNSHTGRTERLKQHKLFPRLDYQLQTQEVNLGEFYMVETEGGKRRFQKASSRSKRNKMPFYLGVSLGIMLLVGSLSVFYVSRRW